MRPGVSLIPWLTAKVLQIWHPDYQFPNKNFNFRRTKWLQHSRSDCGSARFQMAYRWRCQIAEQMQRRQNASGPCQKTHLWWLHVLLSVTASHDVSVKKSIFDGIKKPGCDRIKRELRTIKISLFAQSLVEKKVLWCPMLKYSIL